MPLFFMRGGKSSNPKRWIWGVLAVLAAGSALTWLWSDTLAELFPSEEVVQGGASKSQPATLSRQLVASATADSDGDGLKDWEETLYRTNPANPDTDQDGTPDGRETTEKRDPTKPGPDDKLPSFTERIGREAESDSEKNLTYQFARNLSAALKPDVISKIQGGNWQAQDLAGLSGALPALEAGELLGPLLPLKESDLIVAPQNDANAVKHYFNAVYAVYETTFLVLREDDVTILGRALTTKDFGELSKLDSVVAAFEKSYEGVKKIPVPKGYEDFALKELNYLRQSRRLVENLRLVESDPLGAVAVIRARDELMKEVRAFHQLTAQGLAQNGIAFGAGEGGYAFFQ